MAASHEIGFPLLALRRPDGESFDNNGHAAACLAVNPCWDEIVPERGRSSSEVMRTVRAGRRAVLVSSADSYLVLCLVMHAGGHASKEIEGNRAGPDRVSTFDLRRPTGCAA